MVVRWYSPDQRLGTAHEQMACLLGMALARAVGRGREVRAQHLLVDAAELHLKRHERAREGTRGHDKALEGTRRHKKAREGIRRHEKASEGIRRVSSMRPGAHVRWQRRPRAARRLRRAIVSTIRLADEVRDAQPLRVLCGGAVELILEEDRVGRAVRIHERDACLVERVSQRRLDHLQRSREEVNGGHKRLREGKDGHGMPRERFAAPPGPPATLA